MYVGASAFLFSAKHAKHASSVSSRPVDWLSIYLLLLLALSLACHLSSDTCLKQEITVVGLYRICSDEDSA